MRLSGLVLLIASFCLAACETATPYRAAEGHEYGYSNQQIENNRWSVQFSGNSVTDRQTVETYLLFRAAELTMKNGFDYFEFVRRDTDKDTIFVSDLFATPFFYNFHGVGPHRGYHVASHGLVPAHQNPRSAYYDPFLGGPAAVRELVTYSASAEIFMREGQKPATPEYFDARDVIKSLSPTIVRSNDSTR